MDLRRCVTLILLVGLAVGTGGGDLHVGAETTSAQVPRNRNVSAALPSSDAGPGASWWAVAQEEMRQSEYHVTWQEKTYLPDVPAAYQAPNRAHNLRTYFVTDARSAGIRVLPRTGDAPAWEWGLSLTRYGWAGSESPAGDLRPVGGADLVSKGNRIEYHRSTAPGVALPLVEWYVNDERGLEQGFTLIEPPPAQDGGPASQIVLDLALSGTLTPNLTEGAAPGQDVAIDFSTSDGVRVLRYSDLYAHDATGTPLPAYLSLVERSDRPHVPTAGPLRAASYIRIIVDAADAVYPITIDPLATFPSWVAEGNQKGAAFGQASGTAGDVNGDGYADLVVGAPYFDGGQVDEGRIYVYYGSASGLGMSPAWTAESNQAGASLGWSVGTAGDVNRDGYADLVAGAPYFDGGQVDEGRVYVYHGSASGLGTSAAWTAESDQAEAGFGRSTGTAGDVNGDGYADLVVGAYLYDGGQMNEGQVYVYHGSPSGLGTSAAWTAEGNQAGASLGWSVGTAGDVNGDGYADLIVGSTGYDGGQENEGRACLYLGSASGLNGAPAWTAEGNQAGAWFGFLVGTAGDVNGDGYADLVVGASRYDAGQQDEGRAYLYHGAPSGPSTTPSWSAGGNQQGAWFGYSGGTAGDVNGDGYADLVVGAPQYDGGQVDEGRAYVYYGSASGLDTSAAWTAESNQAYAHLGWSVGTAGDVNRDGYADLVVGAPLYDGGQENEGRAYVYYATSPEPAIAVDKTASATIVRAGETVVYTYRVTNPGDVRLSSVSLTDDRCSPVTFVGGDGNGNNRLDTTETWTYRCSRTLNATTTNTVTARGTDTSGGTVSDLDSATVTVIHPAIAVDKTADATTVRAGETVLYTYRVTNPGDDRLSSVSLTDDRCSPVTFVGGDGNGDNQLNTTETWTYRCSRTLNATTTNTVTARGTDTSGRTVNDLDTATVTVVNPAIMLDKRANATTIGAGQTVIYTYNVINIGDDRLSSVSVTDNKCSPVILVGGDDNGNNQLDTTETWTYLCSRTLHATTTNTATARGTDTSGGTVSDLDTATVTVKDSPPRVGFEQQTYQVNEGDGEATVRVTLDKPSGQQVEVKCSTSNGTAQAPGDYAAVNDRTISFPAGSTAQTLKVYIVDDGQDEPNETFVLTLSDPTHAALDDTRNPATLTIQDDDGPNPMEAYLPAVFKRFIPFAPPCSESNRFCEDNDVHGTAYGPLQPDTSYRAYPDDEEDYYYFVLDESHTVNVTVSGFAPTSDNGSVALYGPAAGTGRGPLIDYYGKRGQLEMSLGPHLLNPGRYYVRVYNTRETITSDTLYTLLVAY